MLLLSYINVVSVKIGKKKKCSISVHFSPFQLIQFTSIHFSPIRSIFVNFSVLKNRKIKIWVKNVYSNYEFIKNIDLKLMPNSIKF